MGLNIPRPSGLASLLYGNKTFLKVDMQDVATETHSTIVETDCQTDTQESHICETYPHSGEDDGDWNHEVICIINVVVIILLLYI